MTDSVVGGQQSHLSRWQGIDYRHLRQKLVVVWAIPGLVEPELLEQLVLLNIRQQRYPPAKQGLPVIAVHDGSRQPAMRVLVAVHGQGQLLERSVGTVIHILKLISGEDDHEAGDSDGQAADKQLHNDSFSLTA